MPLPEGYLPREGDVLSIDVRVKHDFGAGDEYIFTSVVGFSYKDVALPSDHREVFLKRRSWREDEAVVHKSAFKWHGKVVAAHGDHVLVALDPKADQHNAAGGLRIFHCNELLPAPGEEPAASEEPPEAPAETPEPPAAASTETPDVAF